MKKGMEKVWKMYGKEWKKYGKSMEKVWKIVENMEKYGIRIAKAKTPASHSSTKFTLINKTETSRINGNKYAQKTAFIPNCFCIKIVTGSLI